MIEQVSYSEKIEDMIAVARETGDMSRKMRTNPESLNIGYKPGDDSVESAADRESERIIREKLVKKHGGAFIGEETGKTASTDNSNVTWIVDPIDGTTNYTAGTGPTTLTDGIPSGNHPSDPNWGVSIACKEGNQVTQAVIYFPATHEVYWAEKGKGAYVIDSDGIQKKLRLGEKIRKKTSIELAGGFLTDDGKAMDGTQENQLKANLGDAYKQETSGGSRNTGCVVAGLIHVATGARGAYTQGNVNEHDIAAAAFIAEQAGAKIFIHPSAGDKKGRSAIIASHPQVHDKLVSVYQQTRGIINAETASVLQAPLEPKQAIS